jgi:hypothetical protein
LKALLMPMLLSMPKGREGDVADAIVEAMLQYAQSAVNDVEQRRQDAIKEKMNG